MNRMLIVDDEPEILDGLAFLVKKYCGDLCEVCGKAENGLAGELMAVRMKPDIILTDIRMPERDGLEMIRGLKDEIDASYVILSGYADFEYARTAIGLGVEGYLTKPVDEQELRRIILRIKSKREALAALERAASESLNPDADSVVPDASEGLLNTVHGLPGRQTAALPSTNGNQRNSAGNAALSGTYAPETAGAAQMQGYTLAELVPEQELRALASAVDALDIEACRLAVRRIYVGLRSSRKDNIQGLRQFSFALVLYAAGRIPAASLQMNEYLGKNMFTQERAARYHSIDQLENWVLNTIAGMCDIALEESLDGNSDVIEQIQMYIRDNYRTGVSMKDISEKFYINPSYFSQLFKKKTGMLYQDYLIHLRVARAKVLLRTTNMKIYEICEDVGYKDIKHFNQVFERDAGVKPSEYRKRFRE